MSFTIAQLTSQFPHCGNAFRFDTYRGCSFGCIYCFSHNRGGNYSVKDEAADPVAVSRLVNKETGIIGELIRRRVPIHCGGLSDPFQSREFNDHRTLQLIGQLPEYPVMFSTKAASLPDEYFLKLDPEYHVFQLSISGIPDDALRDFEKGTASTQDRIKFAIKLKQMGFTVLIRIQPLISLNWAARVVCRLGGVVDGFTIEHIKFPSDNKRAFEKIKAALKKHNVSIQFCSSGREFEVRGDQKVKNIDKLKSIGRSAVINVGDNDCRLMSETTNCCGLTVCPPSFENWIQFNSMALKMSNCWEAWKPEEKATACLNSTCIRAGWGYADYVEYNYTKLYGNRNQETLF